MVYIYVVVCSDSLVYSDATAVPFHQADGAGLSGTAGDLESGGKVAYTVSSAGAHLLSSLRLCLGSGSPLRLRRYARGRR